MRKLPLLVLIPLSLLMVGPAPASRGHPLPGRPDDAAPASPAPTRSPGPADPLQPEQAEAVKWRGRYYDNRTLDGSPKGERDDACIDFNWHDDSPWSGRVGKDNFSVRWTKDQHFEPGFYQFYVVTDDGARFWIDDTVIISDAWKDQPPTEYSNGIQLQGGTNTLKLEYYEHTGTAQIKLWWEKRGDYPDWKAEYFKYHDDPRFCDGPVLTRNEQAIDYDWGEGSPSSVLGNDFWAARWTGSVPFVGGLTRFFALSDDGVRVWVDVNDNGSFSDSGENIIDQWEDQSETLSSGDIYISPGSHRVRVEYYERAGDAVMRFWWRTW